MFKVTRPAKPENGASEAPPAAPNAAASSNGSSSNGALSNGVTHYQMPIETSTTSRPMSETDALARDIKEGTISGFVGNGTTLTGEATFKGILRVDGHLTGRVSSSDGTLIVGNNGVVEADVAVAVATIHGTVHGDIIATKRIEVGRTASIIGNIQAPSLVVEQGGIIEGNCRMVQPREQATANEQARTPAPAPTMPPPAVEDHIDDASDIAS